jgi:hypothetical protein
LRARPRCRALFATAILAAFGLGACSVHDSRLAESAQTRLIGMPEVDLETCLGVPDQHQSFGTTDILTWYTASASSMSFSIPIVQGPSLSNGGNCHMTVRADNGVATRVLYSGEKNALGAPDAYCAPILRTCLATLDALHAQKGSPSGR